MHSTALRYFLTVARSGSVTVASAQLNVSASAISRQIANLEEALDCILFERRPRGMALSPAGELLASYARRTLLEGDQIKGEIQELRGLSRGFLRVSSSEGFTLDLLPRAIASFRSQHPGIRFELSVQPPAQVSRKVREGEADIGLTFTLTPASGINVAFRSSVEMLAVCAPTHPIAGRDHVSLRQLQAFEIALPASNTTARQVFDAACAIEGVTIEPVLSANALAMLVPFILASQAICILSALSAQTLLQAGALVGVPIRTERGLARSIEIQTMMGRRLPDAASKFIDHLVLELSAA